jgi:murein DD-endopeptidase MepM/ murein hydrolase activator NlpD
MTTLRTSFFILFGIVVVLAGVYGFLQYRTNNSINEIDSLARQSNQNESSRIGDESSLPQQNDNDIQEDAPDGDIFTEDKREQPRLYLPTSDFFTRISKKPFGMYISPALSPVQPERFTGYHTGVDLEVTDDELSREIAVFSMAEGKVRYAGFTSGYGGVVVLEHLIDGEVMTSVYGHVLRSSVSLREGDTVKAGQKIAVLAPDKSSDTDGERKHLHFAIHRGSEVEFRGYVSNVNDLSAWIDPKEFLADATSI